jgi:hypothetical protein
VSGTGPSARLVLWSALALAACSSTFRFDDHSIEAGAPADAPVENPSSCTADRCGFNGAPCGAGSCRLECPHFGSCSGSCGAACSADCEEDSSCMLAAGDDADLRCEDRARCSFQVGRSSTVQCDRGADCGTRCLSSCSLTCAPDAVCTLGCGPSAPLVRVTGSASCP